MPYLKLKRTRKPLFLQLETTKTLKKLKIEEKIFQFFLKSPVSRIVPKNVKWGGTLWNFLNVHFVAKYHKIDEGTLCEKNFPKKVSQCRKNSEQLKFRKKFGQSHSAEKMGEVSKCKKKWKGGPLRFGMVLLEALDTLKMK